MKTNYYQFVKQDDGKNEIYIYGDIERYQWIESDVTSFGFAKELAECEGNIEVHIDSGGGDVATGLAIYNLLNNYDRGTVTTIVDGMAASAASVIFMAGKTRRVYDSSLFLIHNAWTMAAGNAIELRRQADDLERATQPSINVYTSKTGQAEADIKALMDEDRFMAVNEILDLGFATELVRSNEAKQALKDRILASRILGQQPVLKEPEPKENLFANFLNKL